MFNVIFDELFDLTQEMNQLFDKAGVRGSKWPPANTYENKDKYIMVAKVPGIKKEDIQISLKDNALTIRGERKKIVPENSKLLLEERSSGKFERNFLLNEKVDVENIKAETANGLLIINIPKSPESKPRRIEIK